MDWMSWLTDSKYRIMKAIYEEFVEEDANGNRVKVGDFITFSFFWYPPSGEVERIRQGRIIMKGGRLCFRYKLNGHFVTNRLTALCYSAGDDWMLTNDTAYKDNIENPCIWSASY